MEVGAGASKLVFMPLSPEQWLMRGLSQALEPGVGGMGSEDQRNSPGILRVFAAIASDPDRLDLGSSFLNLIALCPRESPGTSQCWFPSL